MLFEEKQIRHEMKSIQSKLSKIHLYSINKISLPCFDNKRYILDEGAKTFAYEHKDVN